MGRQETIKNLKVYIGAIHSNLLLSLAILLFMVGLLISLPGFTAHHC